APETPSTAPTPYFNEGVNRAQSAVAIGQSAQSTDDWSLAANRWKQAVLYMQQVPSTDPNYATAQQKVKEYQANLAIAERRAAGEKPPTTTNADAQRPPGLVASIPVVNQMGGTPVVPVTLTGNQGSQQFTMLFDTGASGTLITPAMAEAIGVVVVSTAVVTVADGRQVEIPVGYVDTLTVGDLVVRDLLVGIGGDVALLGQDVYGEYGLAIGGSKIDLYE
ncbi:MAG TPA: retropepsin-like aspartic protease, partial [Candidatus Obscuribacterales bacterium]